jgi:hypothetical protein
MCDFHSTAWRMIGQDIQCAHLPSNSHSESISAAGWRENEPNRATLIFEAEWSGEGELPSDSKLIRNFGECPEPMVKRIQEHYRRLKEAITTGKYLDTHFSDTKKWCDVWNVAIKNGAPVTLPAIFGGDLYVYGSAKLDALTEVGGDLYVDGNAKLDALTESRRLPLRGWQREARCAKTQESKREKIQTMNIETTEPSEVSTPDEPSFEVALKRVEKEFESVRQRMIEKGHKDWQSVFLTKACFRSIRFCLYGDGSSYGDGDTLSEALQNLPTPVDAKAKKIADLRDELSKLTGEEIKAA